MRNFDLYVSGILYGRLRLGDGTPQIQKLDVHTGALLDWQDLTEQDRDFYRFFVKMDFAALGQNLSHYESGLHGTGEVSLCGERYTSEDGCSYLQRDVKFPNNKQMKEGRLIAVTCPAREMVTVLVEPGAEEETILRLWRSTWPEEQLFPVEHAQTFPVPMRDGVHLSTDVYLPKNCSTPVPAVLVRTPYGKEDGCEIYYRYVQRGYAVVVQDVRGRNASEGEWLPNYHEVEDSELDRRPAMVQRTHRYGGRVLPGLCTVGSRCQRQPPPESSDQRSLRGQRLCGSAPPGWVFHLGHAGLGLCGVSENLPP